MKNIKVKKKNTTTKKVIVKKVETFNRLEEGKTISVDNLPECQHKKRLLKIVQDPVRAKICVLAIRSHDKRKWEAFAGYPDMRDTKIITSEIDKALPNVSWDWLCEHVNTAEDVRFLGERLPKEIAVILFPDWSLLKYSE